MPINSSRNRGSGGENTASQEREPDSWLTIRSGRCPFCIKPSMPSGRIVTQGRDATSTGALSNGEAAAGERNNRHGGSRSNRGSADGTDDEAIGPRHHRQHRAVLLRKRSRYGPAGFVVGNLGAHVILAAVVLRQIA